MKTTPFVPSHERLQAWQKAMELLVTSYRVALRLPAFERYGLAAQLRRAALSVPANIAEGCGRVGVRDRLRFVSIARASLCELETLFAAVKMLGYAKPDELDPCWQLAREVGRLIHGLRRRLASLPAG